MLNFEPVARPGDRIREALKLRDMQQVELTKLGGLNRGAVSSYISGRYNPKQDALHKMALILDVSEMWLAGYDVPMERPEEQRQADAITEIVKRLRADMDFTYLVKKINELDQTQLFLISQLTDQLTRK